MSNKWKLGEPIEREHIIPVFDRSGEPVCFVATQHEFHEANAKTIADAPDLLALVRVQDKLLDELCDRLKPSFKTIQSIGHGNPIAKRLQDAKRLATKLLKP